MLEVPKFIKPVGGEKAPPWFHIVVALSMVLSAGASLVGALRTSETMKELVNQNARMVRASSTPILQVSTRRVHNNDELYFELEVNNVGTGLAQVAWFEVLLDGKPLPGANDLAKELRTGMADNADQDHGNGVFSRSSIADTVIGANDKTQLFKWGVRKRSADQLAAINAQIHALAPRLDTRACYCSVLDECWELRARNAHAEPVARCDAAGHKSFNE